MRRNSESRRVRASHQCDRRAPLQRWIWAHSIFPAGAMRFDLPLLS